IVEGTNASLGASGIDGPFKITYDPDGEHLYVPSFDGGSPGGVVTLASAPATGAHTFVQFLDNDTTNNDGLADVVGAALSSDGLHFYAVSDGDDAVSHWNRDLTTGRLTLVETIGEEAGGPSSLDDPVVPTLSLDGTHLYVSDLCEPLIVVFDRDAVTGTLTFASELEPQDSGTLESMAISADGLFLYAGDTEGDSVQVYSRDSVTGSLTFLQSLSDGVDAEGIAGPESMVLSPDRASLYVGGRTDKAIAFFSRDGGTGLLTFIDQVVDDVDGVDGLDTVQALTLSADGAHLYAVSTRDDAIAVFSRDGGTGALTFLEALFDLDSGVDGLDGGRTVTVSKDGQLVLVGSGTSDRALALFYRDPVNGSLRFAERVEGPFDPATNEVRDLLVSPDGAHLYSIHPDANAVAIYAMPSVLFTDGFESGNTSRWTNTLP
ncbi:MAG: beta-propeller fold lactonase family protein, partial [Acidobacteriota bacterium]